MRVLRVTRAGPSRSSARLDAYVYRGSTPDRGIWRTRQGELLAARSAVRPDPDGVLLRTRTRSIRTATGWRILDRQEFELGGETFVERAHAPGQDAVVLPAELERGVEHRTGPLHRVALLHVGPSLLTFGAVAHERDAIQLRLIAGDDAWDQWLVAGVGEVSLGRVGALPERWLVGWRGGGAALLLDQRGQAAT